MSRVTRTISGDLNGRNDPMSTITEAMPPAPATPAWIPSRLYRMSVKQYEAMAESGAIPTSHRVHLINGYLVEKATQTPWHAVAAGLSGEGLTRVIPTSWHIRSGHPVRLPAQASEPEPDHCVVRGAILDYAERHPGPGDVALIVEVSDSSLADDRKLATEVYGPAGLPVYWIVDVNGRRVEVYTRPGPAGYGTTEVFAEGQSIPVEIDGREVGRIAVADLLPRAEAAGNGA